MSKRTLIHCDNCGKESSVGAAPRWLHIETYPYYPKNNLVTTNEMGGDYCGFYCATQGLMKHSPNASKEVLRAVDAEMGLELRLAGGLR